MADENTVDASNEESVAGAGKSGKRGGKVVTLLLVGLLMLGEGVGVFVLAKFLSPSPVEALAAQDEAASSEPEEMLTDDYAEVPLAKVRLTNKRGAKSYTVNIGVAALVKRKNQSNFEELVKGMQARFEDRVNFVVRSASMEILDQPGLQTLKRQLKGEFDELVGDPRIIVEVLIQELVRSGG